MAMKFFNKKVYIVPGHSHRFRTEHDAVFYCKEHDIDAKTIEKYDSIKEYDRWLQLLKDEEQGIITDLRRQVEYELIPAHVERVFVRNKTANDWVVENEHHRTRKEAEAYCREHGLQLASMKCNKVTQPVYKDVVIEQNAVYTADFVYNDAFGDLVVEDCKSEYTRKEKDYVLRRKLMLHVYGIRILET